MTGPLFIVSEYAPPETYNTRPVFAPTVEAAALAYAATFNGWTKEAQLEALEFNPTPGETMPEQVRRSEVFLRRVGGNGSAWEVVAVNC